jgi:glycerate 2-kinase
MELSRKSPENRHEIGTKSALKRNKNLPKPSMIIKNFDNLATTPLRKQALIIAEAGLASVDTPTVVRSKIRYNQATQKLAIDGRVYNLQDYQRVLCVGFGKAAMSAVTELQKLLGDRINAGFVIDLRGGDMGNITSRIGTHPFATQVNIEATKELVAMMDSATEQDLVICVVSGGGSALLCYPNEMTCETETAIFAALTVKGASIQDINTVRKHVSKVKGGNLAKICYPATVIGLIFSDIPDDDLSLVASGPTMPDATTIHDASAIMARYNILDMCQLPSCQFFETPKEPKYFEKVHNVLMVSGKLLVAACRRKADELGFRVKIFNDQYSGQARELAGEIVNFSADKNTCVIGAGESTVLVRGHGKGGRNQEMALAAMPLLGDGQVLACVASDGADNTDAAGAIVDASTLSRAADLGLDGQKYLDSNDSYSFFEQAGGLLMTGPTGANVSDFFVLLNE